MRIGASHIDVEVPDLPELVQGVVEGDALPVRHVGVRNLLAHLNLVNEEITLPSALRPFLHPFGKPDRIAVGGELGKVKALIRDAFVGTAIFSLVTIAFASFCLPFFFERLRIQSGSLTFLLIVVTVAGCVSTIFSNAMSGLKLFKAGVWFQALAAPVRLVLMLVFMPFRALSGYVVGQGAMPFVYIFGSLLVLKKFMTSPIRPTPYWKEHGREIWAYTWPLLVSAVIGAIGGNMDTLVIRHRLCDFESAGYYIVTRFSEMSLWIGAAFVAFLFPLLAGKNGNDAEFRKMLRHSLVGTMVVGLVISLGLFACGRWILSLCPEWAVYSSLTPHMVLLAVNFLFVPRYGYMACAWGGFAGYGVCMALSYLVGRRKSPVPYKLLPIFGYFALALGLYGISVWLRPAQLGWELALNTLLLAVYVAVALYNERKLVQTVMNRLHHRA